MKTVDVGFESTRMANFLAYLSRRPEDHISDASSSSLKDIEIAGQEYAKVDAAIKKKREDLRQSASKITVVPKAKTKTREIIPDVLWGEKVGSIKSEDLVEKYQRANEGKNPGEFLLVIERGYTQ